MRILVIEDEHRIAASIKKGLELETYAVDLAYDGVSGYDLAVSEEYDVIVMDIMIPGLDGITVCKQLREHNNHTPIIMLTARGQLQDKVEGLNAGADDYLTKPFAFEELIARIRALIRRPKQTTSNTLSVGSLFVNTASFEVKRDGIAIQLSSKEFSLLEYLIRHANTVLTKNQIISHVWNYDADILPNTVEVYIKNLRSKIDEPFKKSGKALIQTVRGFGYKITAN